MNSKNIFKAFFEESSNAIVSKKITVKSNLNGVLYHELPVSRLTYTYKISIEMSYRENNTKSTNILILPNKEKIKLATTIGHDIIVKTKEIVPNSMISSTYFIKIILDNLSETEADILEYHSLFDNTCHTISIKNSNYIPILVYSERKFYAEKNTATIEKSIKNLEKELISNSINIHKMEFKDLFEKKLDPNSSKLAIELIINKTRVEEAYRSFQHNFDHFLKLVELNSTQKREIFSLLFDIEDNNFVEQDCHFVQYFVNKNEVKSYKNLMKKSGFYSIF